MTERLVVKQTVKNWKAEFVEIMKRDIETGNHRDTSTSHSYFTDSYFHRPEEIIQEINEAGFQFEELISVTGFGNVIPDIDEKIKDEKYRNVLLDTLRMTEKDPLLFGVSSHLIGIGKKAVVKMQYSIIIEIRNMFFLGY